MRRCLFDVPAVVQLLKDLDLMNSLPMPNRLVHQLVLEVFVNMDLEFLMSTTLIM